MPHLSDLQMDKAISAVGAELKRQNRSATLINVAGESRPHVMVDGVIIELAPLVNAVAGAVITDTSPKGCPRANALVDKINEKAKGEGWCLVVCGDGMVIIDADHDAPKPACDAYSYVEAHADAGSVYHQVALGLHGMIMTEDE